MQGSANAADALSCLSANALHTDSSFPVVDFRELASAQAGDPELDELRADSSLHFELVLCLSQEECLSPVTHTQAACDRNSHRVTVDTCLMSHPGIRATQHLVTSHSVGQASMQT